MSTVPHRYTLLKTIKQPSDAVQYIAQRTAELNKRADRLVNQKSPTAPVYDLPAFPPAVSIEGQLATDKTGKLWWFLQDEWRTCP